MKKNFTLYALLTISVFLQAQNLKLDPNFNGGSLYHTFSAPTDMVLQPDNKILISGYHSESTSFSLIRINEDGSMDNEFGYEGRVNVFSDTFTYAKKIGLQSDGKIILAGQRYSGTL
jgi:hypothetical protein